MDEDDGWMSAAGRGRGQRTGRLHVAIVNRTSSRASISTRLAVRGAAPSRCQVSETIWPALLR